MRDRGIDPGVADALNASRHVLIDDMIHGVVGERFALTIGIDYLTA
ncbi:MAG: hypothetical protein WAW17_02510 [Rhodococcus sp. (in: high G+C Gram-positive bacteria)]